jgi:hypothetical protein
LALLALSAPLDFASGANDFNDLAGICATGAPLDLPLARLLFAVLFTRFSHHHANGIRCHWI